MVSVRFEGVSKQYEDGFEAFKPRFGSQRRRVWCCWVLRDAVNPPRFGCLRDSRKYRRRRQH